MDVSTINHNTQEQVLTESDRELVSKVVEYKKYL